MDSLEFTVPGRPLPKRRPRGGRGQYYTPTETHNAEDVIGTYAHKGRRRFHEGLLRLECEFYFSSRRHAGDFDNLLKLVADALQRADVIRNDSQIRAGCWLVGDVETLREERTVVRLSKL